MPAALFVENPAGMAALRAAPFMRRAIEDAGGKVKAEAERLSPVRTGHYRASWYLKSESGGAGAVLVRVGNGAEYAFYLEHGTSEINRQRILGRALDALIGSS